MRRLCAVLLPLLSLFKWFGHILFLYKQRVRCDTHIFAMTSHTSTASTAVLILIVVKPAVFLVGRKQSVTDGACTGMLKYWCAGINRDTGWIKLVATKSPSCPKIANSLPLC